MSERFQRSRRLVNRANNQTYLALNRCHTRQSAPRRAARRGRFDESTSSSRRSRAQSDDSVADARTSRDHRSGWPMIGETVDGCVYSHVAPSSCGRYFFQKVHCLTLGPLPISVLLMSNVRYSLFTEVCCGH